MSRGRVPPAVRGRLPPSGLHAPGTSPRTQEGFAVPRRPRLDGGKRTLRYRSGTIPTTERAPPCPCAAGPGNGAAHGRAATLLFSFGPFAYGKDRNRPRVRATRYRTPRGSACSRTFRRLTLSLDQTVQKKKFRDRQDIKERHHAAEHHLDQSTTGSRRRRTSPRPWPKTRKRPWRTRRTVWTSSSKRHGNTSWGSANCRPRSDSSKPSNPSTNTTRTSVSPRTTSTLNTVPTSGTTCVTSSSRIPSSSSARPDSGTAAAPSPAS